MKVFVIPIGPDRYELYCEHASRDPDLDSPSVEGEPTTGIFGWFWRIVGRCRQRFAALLRAAEERREHPQPDDERPKGWMARFQDRLMAWIAERVAEQRLLWSLRRETAVVAAYPPDMTFEQVETLVRRILRHDFDRHRLWLVVDTVLFIASGVFFFIPGPNLVAYYFLFRAGGHWLSMRGAQQGLKRIVWTGDACPPLTELRAAAALLPSERIERVQALAAGLNLPHLPVFFERVLAASEEARHRDAP